MNELIQLLIRHGLASAGGFLAAHNIAGDTTVSIIVGLIFCLIPTVWSWAAKMLHLDLSKGGMDFVTGSEGFRILVGSLVSQGITALSVYFAVDANNPELLLGAVVNAGASKLGLHQKVMGLPAVKLLTACLCVLSLSSCATTQAILSSPFGRAMIASADSLAKQVVETTERTGLELIMAQATAKVAALKAGGVDADLVKETLRLSQIAGFAGVIEAAQTKYEQLTGKRYVLPKNPVNVTP